MEGRDQEERKAGPAARRGGAPRGGTGLGAGFGGAVTRKAGKGAEGAGLGQGAGSAGEGCGERRGETLGGARLGSGAGEGGAQRGEEEPWAGLGARGAARPAAARSLPFPRAQLWG